LLNPWFEVRGEAKSGRLFLRGARALDHPHDVGLFHDQKVLPIDLDFGGGPFSKQHPVARFEVKRNDLAAFVTASRPDGDEWVDFDSFTTPSADLCALQSPTAWSIRD